MATAIITIKEVGRNYIELLDKKVIVVENENYVSAYFLTHFRRMLNLALASDDSELIKKINKIAKEIAIKSLDTKNELSALYFTEFITVIGSKTIEKRKFEMTDEVINTLSDLSSEAAKIKSEKIFELCFGSLARIALEGYRGWPGALDRVSSALSRMIRIAEEKRFPVAIVNNIVREKNKMEVLKKR